MSSKNVATVRVGGVDAYNYGDVHISAVDGAGYLYDFIADDKLYLEWHSVLGSPIGEKKLIYQGDTFEYEVSTLESGGIALLYNDYDGSGSGVKMQVFDKTGSASTPVFDVNQDFKGEQSKPNVTQLENGQFVVSWISDNPRNAGLFQKLFDSSGTAIGVDYKVTGDVNDALEITALKDGRWVATWQDFNAGGLIQQVFDSSGNPAGSEILTPLGTARVEATSVAALPNGGWVVVSPGQFSFSTGFRSIEQVVYNMDGSLNGDLQVVNTDTDGSHISSVVTPLEKGGWVVSWSSGYLDGSSAQDGDQSGVFQQLFSASGTKIGTETQVNSTYVGDQGEQKVTPLSDGGWVVTWRSEMAPGLSVFGDLFQQVFNADGSKRGSELRINEKTGAEGSGEDHDVLPLKDGGWIVTWISRDNSGSEQGIYQRIYNSDVSVRKVDVSVNDAPVGQNKDVTILEDRKYEFTSKDFGFSDLNGDGFAGVVITGMPKNGELRLDGDIVKSGQFISLSQLNSLSWQPDSGDFGTGLATVKFRVKDDGGLAYGGRDTDLSSKSISFNVNDVRDNTTGTSASDVLKGDAGADLIKGSGGRDTLYGLGGDDALDGGEDNDTLVGGSGADRLLGGGGVDTASYAGSTKGLTVNLVKTSANTEDAKGDAYSSIENILGSSYDDILTGNSGANTISGGSGSDKLNGGLSKDVLVGGSGKDMFIFDAKLGAANVDLLKDFSVLDDTIWLDDDVFLMVGKVGDLALGAFYLGNKAHDASDRIIYDKATGKLWYDYDGTGKGAAVQFGSLEKGLSVAAADFDIIA